MKRVQVSSDNGKTWKWRWVDPIQFNPEWSTLNEGDLVRIGDNIHKTIVSNGRLTCPALSAEGVSQ